MAGKISFSIEVGLGYRGISPGGCSYVVNYLNTIKYGWIEDVDTSVDSVSNKLDWFFDEPVNNGGAGFGHDDTVRGGLCNLCDLGRYGELEYQFAT